MKFKTILALAVFLSTSNAFAVTNARYFQGQGIQNGSGLLKAPTGTPTASRALVTNSSSEVTNSSVTATELGYVSGVTSAIQTQITAKESALTFSSPLSRSTNTISIPVATSSVNGYLSSTDWSTFNNKEPAIATGTTLQYRRGDKTWQTLNTDACVETATNQYFTTARARSSLSAGAGISYNSSTGVITATSTATGDVVGPSSATDNALARFDTTTGKLIQNSTASLSDAGALSLTGSADAIQLTVLGNGTQTSNLFEVQKSDATKLLTVANSGNVGVLGALAVTGGVTTLAGVTATGTVTAANLTSGGVRVPTLHSLFVGIAPNASMTGTGNQIFGSNSTGDSLTSGQANMFFGSQAGTDVTTGSNNTVFGNNITGTAGMSAETAFGFQISLGTGSANTVFGALAGPTAAGNGSGNNCFGPYSCITTSSGSNNNFFGYDSGENGNTTGSNNICMGRESCTKSAMATLSGQFVAGSENYPITGVWFGEDRFSTTPGNVTISGSYASGADVAAGQVALIAPLSSGSATPGTLSFQAGTAGASSSTLQTASEVMGIAIGNVSVTGNFKLSTAGNGLYVKEGSNATMGTTTCNGGTGVVVSTTKVTASSRIFLTINASGGVPSTPYVDTRSAGTSFTMKCTAGDTSTVAWLLIEPS